MTNQLSHGNLLPDLSKVTLRRVLKREREIPGGLEAAADAGGDGLRRPGLSFILTPRELPYERRPPGISCSPFSLSINRSISSSRSINVCQLGSCIGAGSSNAPSLGSTARAD